MTDTTTAAEPADAPSPRYLTPVGHYVRRQVNRLARGYLDNEASAVAALARLRNAVGKPIGADPAVLYWTIAGLPESSFVPTNGPSRDELAAHTAITLYAVHQQSLRDRRMCTDDRSIAQAAGLLYAATTNKDGVARRFEALGTAPTWEESVRRARALIRMLNAARIALDYGLFADDLLALLTPSRADALRLRWGREFYRAQYRADHPAEGDAVAGDEQTS